MGDSSKTIDVERLISYSDDLVRVLKDKRDINNITQCLEHSKALRSSCDSDVSELQTSLQDYQTNIDVCKKKTEEAKSEAAADAEIDLLQQELEEEIKKEHLLMDELRIISNEINDLEVQMISVQERRQTLKKLEQDELREQRMLSLYASVTNIIPNLDDNSRISGHIVDRDKKVIEKFEFDPRKVDSLDVCNGIWKMISS
ncbi:kinetochore protein SPC24 homolog [Corylus avellana]|uniref:kinetochore protein SPC24 homolog n=1 Tax=Corylus avellana TaxID=13451 RepID=UPI00286A717B|nr:kinetochore protein SPC24 homolog [Corylus avellana]